MTKFSGVKGYVGASTAIVGINTWSLDYTAAMLDTTDFSASGVRSVIPGVSQWEGSFGGYKDGAPKALASTGATVDLWLVESLSAAAASSETKVWKGTAYINGIHPTVNFDGIVSYVYDYTGDGALTVPTS